MTEAAALTAMASPRRREILRLVWRDERAAGDIHAAMPDITFGRSRCNCARWPRPGWWRSAVKAATASTRRGAKRSDQVGRMLERMGRDALGN